MSAVLRSPKMIAIGVVAAVLLALAMSAFADGKRTVVAYFTEAKGVYVGDDVTVLGVPVGTISKITPSRDQVRVEMEINDDQKLPADARAAIVSKSLVSVRAIVIGPVYDGGPVLADGAAIPLARTTVPVEFDRVKDELVKLTAALGPQGANKKGAASDLVSSTAKYLEGHGADINQTIEDLSQAAKVLADNKGETFATVRNLNIFVQALQQSDDQVRAFETQLASASAVVAKNRTDISQAAREFKNLLKEGKHFFDTDGKALAETLKSLEATTSVLSENRQSIADLLQVTPTAISNLYNILDPRGPAITGALAVSNFGDPAYIVCGGLFALGGDTADCKKALEPLAEYFKFSAPPIGLNPINSDGLPPGALTTPDQADILGKSSQGTAGKSKTEEADLISQLSTLLGGGR
ncbi:MCE family protein [Nocardioides marmoriginsengisoli]|uniref:MCE family protein n=1 Tax=Nocardioides marmoriginsengisoli TaxID=661483 RepID=A0A3N0CHQ8_9ACTN|nr:MCE family protein [Nocardioides marmoriginsengisoli]RNL62791.1 MCE family protein [Nocardioides marmoriginsengisoli]